MLPVFIMYRCRFMSPCFCLCCFLCSLWMALLLSVVLIRPWPLKEASSEQPSLRLFQAPGAGEYPSQTSNTPIDYFDYRAYHITPVCLSPTPDDEFFEREDLFFIYLCIKWFSQSMKFLQSVDIFPTVLNHTLGRNDHLDSHMHGSFDWKRWGVRDSWKTLKIRFQRILSLKGRGGINREMTVFTNK